MAGIKMKEKRNEGEVWVEGPFPRLGNGAKRWEVYAMDYGKKRLQGRCGSAREAALTRDIERKARRKSSGGGPTIFSNQMYFSADFARRAGLKFLIDLLMSIREEHSVTAEENRLLAFFLRELDIMLSERLFF